MRDASTLLVAGAIALGSACSRGHDAAPNPDEKKPTASGLVYVSDEIGGNIVVVDPASAKVVATIAVGKRPRGIKLSRDGKLLYVAVTGSPLGGPNVDESKLPPADRNADGIGVVDIASRKLVRVFKSGQDPEAFDISPDGKTLYVSNEETAEMSVLDLSSGEIRAKVSVGREPEGVTVRPGREGRLRDVRGGQRGHRGRHHHPRGPRTHAHGQAAAGRSSSRRMESPRS